LRERDARAGLHRLITHSEEVYAEAARKLAAFEATFELRLSTLRHLGYLSERTRRR
jgi:hypothetical protein